MNPTQLHRFCTKEVDRIIDRMHDLCAEGRSEDAESLYAEIQDWIVNEGEIEIMSLENLNKID
jgi:hypothetical protein